MIKSELIYLLILGHIQIFGFLLLGEGLSLIIPLPATILGLLCCCLYCVILRKVPPSLEYTSKLLLQYMPIFFIPLVVTIPLFWQQLQNFWPLCLVAITFSTVLTMTTIGKLSDKLSSDSSKQ
jgi:putative effector of murein hydrolase LrgA (UPF0299 family)